MKKLIKGCLGVAAALLAAHFALANVNAGVFSECSPCGVTLCNPCDSVCGPKKSLWKIGGHMEAGLYVNQYGQRNVYDYWGQGLESYSGNTELLNNVWQSDGQMNSAWVYAEKALNKRGLDFGGRVDFVYGTDARYLQSDGLEYRSGSSNPSVQRGWGEGDYYAAVAQAYGEVGNKNLSVKIGKFLTPLGHESIVANERFFYSLGYAFAVLPHTHTGAIATWSPNDKFSVFGGWVNGEAQTFADARDNAALFGAKFAPGKRVSVGYSALIGQYDNSDFGYANLNYFVQSAVVNFKPNKRWEYTFEWTLRNEELDGQYWGAYGINNELIYRFNKKWAVGLRAEWMQLYNTQTQSSDVVSSYGYTLGVNWTPTKWLLIRPELRYDKVYDKALAFGGPPFNTFGRDASGVVIRPDGRDEQFAGGVSAVVKF